MSNKLNPDSVVLQQLDEHWQKIAMLLLWKLAGQGVVRITAADIEACQKAFAPGVPFVFTHGRSDAFEFSLIDEQAAHRLAEHDKKMRGHG